VAVLFARGGSSHATALGLLLAVGLAGTPAATRAQSATVRAKRHNAEARKLFDLGRFEQAARAYEQAYLAKPLPVFIFNLAQCHKRIDRLENQKFALHYFERYLATPAGAAEREKLEPQLAAVRQRIEELEQRATSQARQETTTPTSQAVDEPGAASQAAVVAPRPRPDLSPPAPAPGDETLGAAPVVRDQPEPAPPDRPIYKKWWFWTVAGAAVVGGVVIAVAVSQRDDWEPGGPKTEWGSFSAETDK
jgi:tetratricopeptide (TPR) repeat protein